MAYQKIYSREYWENFPSEKTAINKNRLNNIEGGIDAIDDRVCALDTTKVDLTKANDLVEEILWDESNGTLTVVKMNGSRAVIDTKLEKLAVNFTYNPQTQQLVITLDDGTVQNVDLSSLITEYEFLDSDTIAFEITDGKVKASVKNGSITEDKLQPNFLEDIKVEVAKAQAASESAANSRTNAELNAANAAKSATAAKASEETATKSASAASASATQAKTSETNASNAQTSTIAAKDTAVTASEEAKMLVKEATEKVESGAYVGPPGIQGPQGERGEKGEKGDQGPVGATGATGPKGDTGATGAAGKDGATGATGPQGPQGPKGDTGATGATGPQGIQGVKGDPGPKGEKGDKGDSGVTVPINGLYTLSGDSDGNLWCYYADGTTAPKFEVDSNGNIYYITPDE